MRTKPAIAIALALALPALAPITTSGAATAGADFYKYTTYNPDLPAHTLSAKDFAAPSGFAKPQTWWHWINGNVSREGIEADLRAMSENGYGFARIFSVNSVKHQGPLKFASPEWFDTFKFTVETAAKYGMGIGIHNCDGWSEAGGPWITPELSMKELTLKTIRVTGDAGGAEQTITLPALDRKLDFARDIAVLAWPARRPALLAMHRPGVLRRAFPSTDYSRINAKQRDFAPDPAAGLPVRGMPGAVSGGPSNLPVIFDGIADDRRPLLSYEKTAVGADAFTGVTLEFAAPFEAAGVFTEVYWMYELPLNIFLEASDDGVNFEKVCELKFRQSDTTAAFAPRRARFWRIVRYQSKKPTERVLRGVVQEHILRLSEIELLAPGESSRAAFPIENFPAKAGVTDAGGLAHATTAPFPEKLILKPGEIQNLTDRVTGLSTGATGAGGAATLRWRVPDGEWVVMRIGYTTTGKVVHPATPSGRGLEVDKFEPSAVGHHFESYDRKMIAAAGPLAGKTFAVIETDSWEAGHQNWTENFPAYFRDKNGYDILPWLPVYAGECIENVDTTESFLHDLRRTFSSLVMGNFYGKLGSLTRAAGLKYETEGAGGIYMRDPMNSFREADYPMTEVWQEPREPGVVAGIRSMQIRETFSTAHFYGKQYITCEALTSRKGNWAETPWIMKGTLDTLLLAGPNVSVFHTYTHQPDERAPGWQMEPWGISQNRKMPWWPLSKAWFTYIARVQYMLQQGKYAARILYLYSDEIPASGASLSIKTALQYDVINGDGARDFLRVENGRLLSPGQMRYDVMFVSPQTSLRLETLEKLKALLDAGATIAAQTKPAFNPTLRGGQAAAQRWRALADELFGDGAKAVRKIGSGRLFTGHTPDEVAAALGLLPPFTSRLSDDDLAWHHREHADGTEWFWVINRDSASGRSGIMSFRVTGKTASLWHPESGKTEPVPAAVEEDGCTRIPLSLGKLEGVFVVFENKKPSSSAAATAVKIISDGAEIFPKPASGEPIDNTKITGDFTFAVTVSPAADRKITQAASSGICSGMGGNENFIFAPEPMHEKLKDGRHAAAGLSVGKNSIAVFEHGAGYYNSIIVRDEPVAENTQVAVVYKNNTPALYINGKQVAAAAKSSGRVMHPPAEIRPAFRGKSSGFILETPPAAEVIDNAKITGDFTFAVTVSPAGDRKITAAAASGICSGMGGNENFIFAPEPMHEKLKDGRHAAAGLSVGGNSVAVFEHGAGYFNSIIVWDHPVAESTQVAVVYKNNTPALYINGKQVAAAAKSSGRVMHPPAAVRSGYKGRAEDFVLEKSALSAPEIAALASKPAGELVLRGKPGGDAAGLETAAPRLFVTRDGRLAAEFSSPGRLEIEKAGGAKVVLAADAVPAPRPVAGPFTVTFDPKWGAPAGPRQFGKLVSWTENPEPGIRHYSGAAVYTNELDLPAPDSAAGIRVYIEIDEVCEVAEVSVNGRPAGTLWRPPYKLDVTDYIKKGKNTLSITVANTWVNRCLYDATLPEGERLTWANSMPTHYPDPATIKPGDYFPWRHGPLPSGLIGELRLVYTKTAAEPR
ncbi:MAG: hypothetical protein LBC18_04435 [Opitutaceae bacterium]|jgi:hypothetical protein|nr:hypothetical protein [Opitutaceae bacterium]